MQDAVTAVINASDAQCQYLDSAALATLMTYFQTGELRIRAATTINAKAAEIVKDAVAQSLSAAEITRPGGRFSSTRRYAACVRDLDYFLRYATYAMLASDTSILDERVLNGLKQTYHSLGVPIDATVQAIQAMKQVTINLLGDEAGEEMGVYFDYICDGLS